MKDKYNLVGTKIPEFKLPNSRGETSNIREFLGQNIVLVLFRSKNWPYSKAHVQKLGDDFGKFKQYNAVLFTILPDTQESAEKFEKLSEKKFPIYYDSKKKVNKMLKQEVNPLKMGRMPQFS